MSSILSNISIAIYHLKHRYCYLCFKTSMSPYVIQKINNAIYHCSWKWYYLCQFILCLYRSMSISKRRFRFLCSGFRVLELRFRVLSVGFRGSEVWFRTEGSGSTCAPRLPHDGTFTPSSFSPFYLPREVFYQVFQRISTEWSGVSY